MAALNLSYNPALNSASVRRGVLLNDSNYHINPFTKLWHDCGCKRNIAHDLLLVWVGGLHLHVLSHLSNTVPYGSESRLQPDSRRSLYGQQTRAKRREQLSLCQPVSLHFPLSAPSLFQTVVDNVLDNNLHGIWNMSHFPPKNLCVSFLHKQKKESAASVVDVETFRASQEVNICNNWHPEDNSRVWSLYRGYFGSWRQFWLMPLYKNVVLIPTFFSFADYQYIKKIESRQLVQKDQVSFCFFTAKNWVPVVHWWNLLSSDEQAAFNVQIFAKRRQHNNPKGSRDTQF